MFVRTTVEQRAAFSLTHCSETASIQRSAFIAAKTHSVYSGITPACLCCQVEMERLRKQEEAASAARDRAQLEQRVQSVEQQLEEKQDVLQVLQVSCWTKTGADAQRQSGRMWRFCRHRHTPHAEDSTTEPPHTRSKQVVRPGRSHCRPWSLRTINH